MAERGRLVAPAPAPEPGSDKAINDAIEELAAAGLVVEKQNPRRVALTPAGQCAKAELAANPTAWPTLSEEAKAIIRGLDA